LNGRDIFAGARRLVGGKARETRQANVSSA
jgi:hypothetical protein